MLEKLNADYYHAKRKNSMIIEALESLAPGSSILDIGAGQMPFRKYCTHLKYQSQDFCKYDGEGDGKGIHTVIFNTDAIDIASDITSIPVPDCCFDAILCTEVLEHVIDPMGALTEMSRILKPGGAIILTVPGTSLLHFSPYHYFTGFKVNYFAEMFGRNGIKELRTERIGNIYTVSALNLWYIAEKMSKFLLPSILFRALILGLSPIMATLLLLGQSRRVDPETVEAGIFVLGAKKCAS
jgi:SAM-dependent methyltransferase